MMGRRPATRLLLRIVFGACAVVLSTGHARAADTEINLARKAVKRANDLAAEGNCAAAVPEFTNGYRTLKDPAILFNRAECLRKLGKSEQALADYRQFLTDLPRAPNRNAVNDRIAELVAKVAAQPAPPPPPAPRKSAATAPEPAHLLETPPQRKVKRESTGVPAWIWIGLGVVLASGGAAGWWYARRDPTEIPESSLGGVTF
jgi:tetratricopeptide (TPR) repeat protein